MKKLLILLCPYMLFGCAYVEDRARDATDMITVAAEFPAIGAAVWGGSFAVGLTLNPPGHGFGLRSGAVGLYECGELAWFGLCIKDVRPSEADRLRGKGYESGMDWCTGRTSMQSGGWFNYGQVEVTVGVGPGVRVGVNFVEIVDFVVGFLGIDLCDDDIAGRQGADAMAPKPPPIPAKTKCGAGGCSPARRDCFAPTGISGISGGHHTQFKSEMSKASPEFLKPCNIIDLWNIEIV